MIITVFGGAPAKASVTGIVFSTGIFIVAGTGMRSKNTGAIAAGIICTGIAVVADYGSTLTESFKTMIYGCAGIIIVTRVVIWSKQAGAGLRITIIAGTEIIIITNHRITAAQAV